MSRVRSANCSSLQSDQSLVSQSSSYADNKYSVMEYLADNRNWYVIWQNNQGNALSKDRTLYYYLNQIKDELF